MRLLALALLLIIPLSLHATTLIVDGPGDGDASGTDDFDSIREALMDLGASGLGTDGASDEIHVVVDALTESQGLIVNGGTVSQEAYQPVRDSLTVLGDADGNGERCVVDIGRVRPVLFGVYLANHQRVTLKGMILIPTFVGGDINASFLVVGEGSNAGPLQAAGITLDRVMITASLWDSGLSASVPRDPDDLLGGGTAVSENFENNCAVLLRSYSPGSVVSHVVSGCVVAHQRAPAVVMDIDGGSLEMFNSRITHNGYFFPAAGGITVAVGLQVQSHRDSQIHLENVRIDRDLGNGLYIFAAEESGSSIETTVAHGCRFENNGGSGIYMRGRLSGDVGSNSLCLAGTGEQPIVVANNADLGIYAVLDPLFSLSLAHVMITDNGIGGTAVDVSHSGIPITINDCLFARNATSPVWELTNRSADVAIRSWDPPAPPVSAEFSRCTFHDLAGSLPDGGAIPHLLLRSGSDQIQVSATVIDSIFSGSSDEVVISGISNMATAFFAHTVLTLDGPNALGAVVSGEIGVINLTDYLDVDPMYVNTDPASLDTAFDVQNPVLRAAASDGGPLSGWGDYVGPTGEEQGLILH